MVNGIDKDLAVADLPGLGGGCDGLDGLVDDFGCDCDFDLSFGRKLTAYSVPR